MGDNRLREALTELHRFSEEQNQRYERNINELLGERTQLVYDVRKTIRSVRAAADKLDHIQWSGDIVRATAYGSGLVGGLSTVGAGIATLMTAGLAVPLVVAGGVFGVGGVITHLAGNAHEAYKKSNEIERADKDWKEALDSIRRFIRKIEDMKNEKKGSILNAILQYLNPALKSSLFGAACVKGKEAVDLMKKGIKEATFEATKESVDDVAKAGTEAFIKNNAKVLSKVMIGVGAVFVIWDTVNMVTSIKDVVFKKKSEAGRVLREKADYLEHLLQYLFE